MAIEVFNRYEQKYMLDKKTYEKVLSVISKNMDPDPYNVDNGAYTISNIYFDTNDDYLIRRSLEKPKYKEKLRLRSYGVSGPDSIVYLEIKKKFNKTVNKRRTPIKLKDAYDFIKTGIRPFDTENMNTQVLSEIEYFLKRYPVIPKVQITYDRIAYFERNNADLRVSFDTNIRARRNNIGPEKGTGGDRIVKENYILMEIKTSSAIPLWLSECLCKNKIKRVSFSKYGTEFKKYIKSKTVSGKKLNGEKIISPLKSAI